MNTTKRVLAAVALAGAALTVAGTAQAAEPREELSSYLVPSHDGVGDGSVFFYSLGDDVASLR
ncbi:hypothetical protein ACFYYB_04350 [Streptomyces sp. NPDC002886]|uniref:hypothetical protein n=1 Tax=Streptomyces sp. NPDC002886 TaxID=3364667 RepID=UPI003679FE55